LDWGPSYWIVVMSGNADFMFITLNEFYKEKQPLPRDGNGC